MNEKKMETNNYIMVELGDDGIFANKDKTINSVLGSGSYHGIKRGLYD